MWSNLANQPMESRIFHGNLTPDQIARALLAEFNRGNVRAQQFGADKQIVVQIATHEFARSGGRTGMSVTIQEVPDGVAVKLGQQAWIGVVASLGQTLLATWHNPWNLLGRLDDLAQDYENINLVEAVWSVIEDTARTAGATFELSERLKRLVCSYCDTANPVGEPSCVACGAPLGKSQPKTCPNCGFVVKPGEIVCPNCRQRL